MRSIRARYSDCYSRPIAKIWMKYLRTPKNFWGEPEFNHEHKWQ